MSDQTSQNFEIFVVATPGLEKPLLAEMQMQGFSGLREVVGGVVFDGGWPDVWRANLVLRGTTRVVARFAQFRAQHLAQLDKRAHKVEWAKLLRQDVPVKVEMVCKKSKIYHSKAAQQRVEKAITDVAGVQISQDATLRIMGRIEKDIVTFSVDTSGESLHKRGFKQGVAKAPMRETMASMILSLCNFRAGEPLVDPMCGSGTFLVEGAEIAAGLMPGRARRFSFQDLKSFDEDGWTQLLASNVSASAQVQFYGFDRDHGAVRMSTANAERAGVGDWCQFAQGDVADLVPPCDQKGLVIVNPPYGARIGNKAPLLALYRTMGKRLKTQFSGWRVGLVTSDISLAEATGLKLTRQKPAILHGGLRIHLFTCDLD